MTASLFLGAVPDRRRCDAKAKSTGARCRNPAAHGTHLCRLHGGSSLALRAKVAHERVERRYAAEAARHAREPNSAPPLLAIHDEMRRTVGIVRSLEQRINALLPEQWADGLTADELRRLGIRPREAAQIAAARRGHTHPAIELYERERAHLVRLSAIMLSNRVDDRRAELTEEIVDSVQCGMDAVIAALGHDPADARVRAVVAGALARAASR